MNPAYDIIYYISAVIIIFTSLVSTFSKDIVRSAYAVFICMIGVSAIYTLIYSELFALVNILVSSAIALIVFMVSPKISPLSVEQPHNDQSAKAPFAPIIIISLLSAIVSSIASITRWQKFEIDYNTNTYLFVFSKYLFAVILLALISSVIIFSAGFILKKGKNA